MNIWTILFAVALFNVGSFDAMAQSKSKREKESKEKEKDTEKAEPLKLVKLRDVAINEYATPGYSGVDTMKGVSNPGRNVWVELEFAFSLERKGGTRWVDGLDFKWEVLLFPKKGKSGTAKPILLTRNVVYRDINLDHKEHVSTMYLSPVFCDRYFGGTLKEAEYAVRLTVTYAGKELTTKPIVSGGKIVTPSACEGEADRYEIVGDAKNILLRKSETPFSVINAERYLTIERGE